MTLNVTSRIGREELPPIHMNVTSLLWRRSWRCSSCSLVVPVPIRSLTRECRGLCIVVIYALRDQIVKCAAVFTARVVTSMHAEKDATDSDGKIEASTRRRKCSGDVAPIRIALRRQVSSTAYSPSSSPFFALPTSVHDFASKLPPPGTRAPTG